MSTVSELNRFASKVDRLGEVNVRIGALQRDARALKEELKRHAEEMGAGMFEGAVYRVTFTKRMGADHFNRERVFSDYDRATLITRGYLNPGAEHLVATVQAKAEPQIHGKARQLESVR